MNHIQVDELDKKPKKSEKHATKEIVEVIPNFLITLIITLIVTNLLTGFALYAHKGLITEHWRAKLHEWTKPTAYAQEVKKPEPTATPQATPKDQANTQPQIVPMNVKGGCDTTKADFVDGVCYPKAGY